MGVPLLTRDQTNERLKILGIGDNDLSKITALEDLLAAAIAEWADLEEEDPINSPVDLELQEWTEEWLFG